MTTRSRSYNVSVARSDDAGKTWSPPVAVNKLDYTVEFNDKDAVAAGRNPAGTGHNVYATYDGFNIKSDSFGYYTDWDLATSTDGGKTWAEHQILNHKDTDGGGFENSCDYEQVIGANPLVNPSNGTLYVAALMIRQLSKHDCSKSPVTYSEVIVRSTDGGTTFSPIHTVATLIDPVFELSAGPSQFMRLLPLPYLAMTRGHLWMSWDDHGGGSSSSRIFVSRAAAGGAAVWSAPVSVSANSSAFDVQPSMVGDSSGLHIAYFEISNSGCGRCLRTMEANSGSGAAGSWTSRPVSDRAFPFVLTAPQFDPGIAPGYMGDYLGIATDGSHRCMSWGDNRDIVVDYLYRDGRHDPDVYGACT